MTDKEIVTLDLDAIPATAPARDHYAVRLAEYAANAKGAFSSATERARKADLSLFVQWCIDQGREPLPATPETVKAYIGHLDTLGRASSTIERHLQSIAHAHKAAKADIPTRSDKVRLTMRALKRRLVDTGEQRGKGQAQPLTYDLVQRLIDTCKADAQRVQNWPDQRLYIAALRDIAIISLAYASLMRRGEIVALTIPDIDATRGAITIRKSKTDQEGKGAKVGADPDTMGHLIRYLHKAGHTDGAVFRSNNGLKLDGRDIGRIIQRRAAQAGIEASALSAHSTRVGAAVDAASAGRSIVQIQRDGRWKGAAMIARYTHAVDAERDAAERAEQVKALYSRNNV